MGFASYFCFLFDVMKLKLGSFLLKHKEKSNRSEESLRLEPCTETFPLPLLSWLLTFELSLLFWHFYHILSHHHYHLYLVLFICSVISLTFFFKFSAFWLKMDLSSAALKGRTSPLTLFSHRLILGSYWHSVLFFTPPGAISKLCFWS